MVIQIPKLHNQPKKAPVQKKEQPVNPTLQGVLVNTHLRDDKYTTVDFNEVCDSLMISQNQTTTPLPKYTPKESEKSFDIKKAILPLVLGTGVVMLTAMGVSFAMRKFAQKKLDLKNITPDVFNKLKIETPPDMALNYNIKQEPEFAIYRILRDPSSTNIVAAAAIFLMSGITVTAKNLVDGAKDIWVKKQEADIERDLQENLISVETKSFSGKLQEVNRQLREKIDYFKNALGVPESAEAVFRKHFTFTGTNQNAPEEKKAPERKEQIKSRLPYVLGIIGGIGLIFAAGKITWSNFKKVGEFSEQYREKFGNEVLSKVGAILKGPKEEIEPALHGLLTKIGVAKDKIRPAIKNILAEGHKAYGDAHDSMGGLGQSMEKLVMRSYCYLDEPRGLLYNWVINPDNSFARNIFLASSAIGSGGYLFKQGTDALKAVAVSRENSKTELGLKERLVEVEIENFKSKKNSAIVPLMDNFNYHLKQEKPKEEMKKLAENILFEIKNGPPYVYS